MLRPTLTLPVALVAALAGCADNFDEDLKAVQDAPYLSTGGTTGMMPTTGPGTSADGTTGASASGDDDGKTTGGAVGTTGATASDITTSGDDTSGADGNSSGGDLPPPTIQDVDMPVKVALAGPVPFTATTMYATSARALLDGVDIGALHDDGDGVFSGTVRSTDRWTTATTCSRSSPSATICPMTGWRRSWSARPRPARSRGRWPDRRARARGGTH
jgi:hypothetical protein